ncbi:MAG TPA: DegT/DnrJ/EryC1/StrS family aminotransferase [bacterium]|nr:DegT/DnrJ/EryC1/StrS family aminotransferase [bacterium]
MTKKIPLFKLNYDKNEEQAVLDTIRSKWISTGPKSRQMEDYFSDKIGSKYCLTLTNCTSALHVALIVAGVGKGDEVLVPSLSFVATANVVKYTGATPVFCDITSYQDLTISPKEIEKKITDKTKAIIPMHYGGFGANMEKISEIAEQNNIKIVEDASHAPMATYREKHLGTIGDIGCFSFYSNKNISVGEGGMLVTDDQELYERAKLLRSHGMTSLAYNRKDGNNTYDVIELGYNYRMDDIRASLGLVQMKKLSASIQKLQEIRSYYVKKLLPIDGIVIPFENYKSLSTNYIFPIVLENSNAEKRDQVRAFLKENGIQTSVHYPAIHEFSIYNQNQVQLPKTEYVARNEITLPLFTTLKKAEIDYIAEILQEAL